MGSESTKSDGISQNLELLTLLVFLVLIFIKNFVVDVIQIVFTLFVP